MRKIASFQVDHTRLERGMYVSRIDGDVTTYDIRMKKPNAEPVLSNAAIHSIEHLVATFLRSSELAGGVLYFGPMGCRTGFYLLVRGVSGADSIRLVREAFEFLASYDGPLPGASEAECGNWRDHDLAEARSEAASYAPILAGYTEAMLSYDR
ncbi:MAG: S-ribosylhomocysteine lyase [Spirochaetes bacterium]|nr:S-ribosylhomocysteine lyase [Spirochaetota bacterium]MBU1079253.1 S-ribosylhomocysteine lyase [Spirochaetota bacterium]